MVLVAVTTNRSKHFVKRVFSSIGKYIDGSKPDTHNVGRIFWRVLTRYLFEKIHESFVIRSLGGTDELGNSFKPLKKVTIAKRPITKGNLSGLGLTKKQTGTSFKDRTRGLLTPEEDSIWRETFARVMNGLSKQVSKAQAKKIAAKAAWGRVKKLGAKTRIDTSGS